MWCNRGGEEVRWGCPARGHGAVATQTRGCSQCLYQRLPKSCGNIRVNAAGRAVTIRRERVSRSRRCSYARNRRITRKTSRRVYKSACTREKGGTGNDLGGGFSRGFSRGGDPKYVPVYARKERDSTKERKRERRERILYERGSARERGKERRGRRRWRSESGLRRVLSTQDRHPATCQQTLPTREEHVGEKSPGKHERMERARRDRKREREKGRETGSLRGCEEDGGSVPTRLTTTRKERRCAPL